MGDSAITTRRSSSRLIAQQQAKAQKSSSTHSTSTSSAPKQVNNAAKEVIDSEQIQKLTQKYDKENHQKRLDYLKRQVFAARRDNWLYPPVETILSGQHSG